MCICKIALSHDNITSNLHIHGSEKVQTQGPVFIIKHRNTCRSKGTVSSTFRSEKRRRTHFRIEKNTIRFHFRVRGESRADSLTTLIDSYLQWSPLYRYVSHGATWIAFLPLRATLYASSRKTRSVLVAKRRKRSRFTMKKKKRKKFSEIAKRSIKINIQPYSKIFRW